MQLCKSYVVVKRRDWWTGHQWIPQTQFRWETDSSVNRPFTTAITINGDRIIKRRAPWKRDEERGGWPKNTHKIIKMSTPPNVLAIPSMITIVIDVWSVSIHHHDQTRGLFLLWGCPLWNRWMGVNLYAYLIGPDQIPFVETQTPIDLFFKWTDSLIINLSHKLLCPYWFGLLICFNSQWIEKIKLQNLLCLV